jgi:subtilisin family serine protease
MRQDAVRRRFQVRARDAAAVAAALNAAAAPLRDEVTLDIDPEAPAAGDILTVRLLGTAKATAAVREKVPAGTHVSRDFVDLPLRKRDLVYPDPRVGARIDPQGRAAAGPPLTQPVIVAVVDSGIAVTHPDLRPRLWAGNAAHGVCVMDPPADATDVSDRDGHGTLVAGTIAATAGNMRLELMAVKIFDAASEPRPITAARGIEYAVKNGAHIINLSFDIGIGSPELKDAVELACDADVLVVFAAGNNGSNNDEYRPVPARYADRCREKTLVVMASDWYDERPTFSNFGPGTVDLAAPGVRIVSTRARWSPGKKYALYTGTSPAAAHVSGALARLKARSPLLKAKELKEALVEAGDLVNKVRRLPRLKCSSGRRLRVV